ncbi:MAG TPA: hypothetical protein VM260_21220 [Pirellula sp.]|nr:hypothetical protein [Pirellula sp.]
MIESRVSGVRLKEELIQSELRPFAESATITLSTREKERLLSRLRPANGTNVKE